MVRAAVDIRRRQPAIDVTLAIGVFGRQRAGGAGPDEHGNAIGAMARDRIGNRATKTVLLQRQRGEPGDATVPLGPPLAQRELEAIDRPDPARHRPILHPLLAPATDRTAVV